MTTTINYCPLWIHHPTKTLTAAFWTFAGRRYETILSCVKRLFSTDMVWRATSQLTKLYPALVRHGGKPRKRWRLSRTSPRVTLTASLLLKWWRWRRWDKKVPWAPHQTIRRSTHSRTGPCPLHTNSWARWPPLPITKWRSPLIGTKWRKAPYKRRRAVYKWYWMWRPSKKWWKKKWSYTSTLEQ